MADDYARTLAGHLGVAAVLANAMIDSRMISREDLCDRFRQARDAAAQSTGGQVSAQILAAMVHYLEQAGSDPPTHQ